MNVLSNKSI